MNPRRIEVAIPTGRRLRRADNGRFAVRVANLDPADVDFVDQIPVVVAAVAISQALTKGAEGGLISQAITAAARRELLSQLGEARLRVALADRHHRPHRTEPAR